MNESAEAFLRVAAARARRALPLASSYRLTPDPVECFAIAPLRVVAEDLIQVVAYGNPDDQPSIAHEALPLSRRTAFLEPFSIALEEYIQRSVANGGARIYLPHANALEVIALLAPRLEHNREASPVIQRLGYWARVIRELAHEPGQQVVVLMSDELQAHAVSGASPIKEAQLRYMITWMNPPVGIDVELAAEAAALSPAAAMLYFKDDEKIEALRHELRTGRGVADEKRAAIEAIQDQNARREWLALTDARDALWRMALSSQPRLNALMAENVRTLARALADPHASPKHPKPMAKKYADFAEKFQIQRAAALEADDRALEGAVESGHAVRGVISTFDRPRGKRSPQMVELVSHQRSLRLRVGAEFRDRRNLITARVVSFPRQTDGSTIITLDVQSGFRSDAYNAGDTIDLLEGSGKPFFSNRDLKDVSIPGLDNSVALGTGLVNPAQDLLQVARRLRGNT